MKSKKVLAVLFAVMILLLPILTAMCPKKSFSDRENRVLSAFPSLSADSLLDKSFMNGFDAYVSDHFFGRDFWVGIKSAMELMTMKKENNGILLLNRKTLAEDLAAPDERKVSQNIDGIRVFSKNNPTTKIYLAFAPTACDLYSDALPYGKSTWRQKELIDRFYTESGERVYGIDLYSALSAKRDQYIYYNTDHHWTSLGAYYAYSQIASVLGFKPYDKSQFDIEHATDDFTGTLYSKSSFAVAPDTIDLYTLAGKENRVTVTVNDGKKQTVQNSLYFRDFLQKSDKYSVFCGQVQPEITIRTNVQNQKKLLIFKDSYAHSLVPFLSLHYAEIKMIDLRYVNRSYRELVNPADFDDVLLLYNVDSICHAANIAALAD